MRLFDIYIECTIPNGQFKIHVSGHYTDSAVNEFIRYKYQILKEALSTQESQRTLLQNAYLSQIYDKITAVKLCCKYKG